MIDRDIEISFKDVDHSAAVEHRIRARVAELGRLGARLVGCRVVVAKELSGRGRSPLFQVRVVLVLPGGPIAINRQNDPDHAHEDVTIAIRDAFNAAERKLKEHLRRQRGEVKNHDSEPQEV
jgi:ribosome-associated translation inhibitor RaiA